ncbi:MAG: hypothetical protein LBT51_07950 [Fusobacteriaceae bacterium]|jgi:type II secretory pathway pseudopilin PulG|nr:hypothetical protein [Fusobacteriaceae bacterium]
MDNENFLEERNRIKNSIINDKDDNYEKIRDEEIRDEEIRRAGTSILQKILYGIVVILIFAIITVQGVLNVKDLGEQKKAEETLKNLKEIRIALEKYFQATKDYPDLSKDGACDNLNLLDYYDKDGNLISFSKIYGKNQMPNTPGNDKIDSSNYVRNISDFKKPTASGGWNYNYTDRTGEIHANLPKNAYSQEIEWDEY